MPAFAEIELGKMETYTLTREIPVEEGYDVFIAGGGPAGAAAAVCAARLGAKVLLVEATGCLGGMCTSGIVATFGPMGDGAKTLVGGFTRELIETMYNRDLLGPEVTPEFWVTDYNRWIPFKPEGLKRLLDEFCVSAGVEIRFFTRVVDAVVENGKVVGAIINNIEGHKLVRAKTYIDATGDAVLADLCGVECKVAGRDWPHAPATLCSMYGGIDWAHPAYGNGHAGNEAMKSRVKFEFLPKANEEGHFTRPEPHIAGMKKIGYSTGCLNAGHLFELDGLNCKSLTDGMIFGRKLAVEYTEFYRKYIPGCEGIEHLTTAPLMGIRDTRRIVGEFELTMKDYAARRQFPDQVCVYNRPNDVHPTNASMEEHQRFLRDMKGNEKLGRGECVGIPYSILVPRGSENLWVAGRCDSSDSKVHGSIRALCADY
ncbi:MAG: FAD-dependent oxidoreductase, partial [Alphaproteobacteria bacterium]